MKPGGLWTFGALFLTTFLFLLGCDDEDTAESGAPSGSSQPSQSDLVQGTTIARQAGAGAAIPEGDSHAPVPGYNDLSVLGGDANQNQQAFRQRFGLSDPTPDQLAQWEEYNARLTAYSNKDADWQYPTAASANWIGTTWTNGDHSPSKALRWQSTSTESLAAPSSTFPLWACTQKQMTLVLPACGHSPTPARVTMVQPGRVE
jgi:hypothetical protein